jgi:tetratricopeptide (TPR) repeat protein
MSNQGHDSESPAAVIGGRFAVEEALGRGGMAAVYRVRDLKTGKRFALKRSRPGDRAKAARQRAMLEREFHTLAQLRHPRIIEVYDYGVDEHGPYYTMELLDGADLDQAGRLPWREACALLRDIASSLAIVHSRGLLHRDVSSRNVRRTADGSAKLIDFGAMVSMGVSNDVVGTAPFMAPEVLQMQALDARADLFSLGALGYYLLTGRHAFPARRTADLRDAWRSRPIAPARVIPEIPAALSALVLQLLALDRGVRPQTAAEVMERLCQIADLPKEELPEIVRGYLSTPTLIGRHGTLLAIRSRILALVRNEGGVVVLEGVPGSGRSRMIDACVFEGKLLSATVVRAGAGDADEPWGVARSLSSQLFGLLPHDCLEATRLSAGVLGHVIEELRGDESHSSTVRFPERSLILRELRDFVLALAHTQRLLIVVDDADRIDEASAAWLAALAGKAENEKLLIVVAMEVGQAPNESPALHLIRSLGHRVPLPALDSEQTEALMRSMFGDVPNLGLVAGRIHSLAHGNPRAIMELAQHLVDRGVARYESGSWLLPAQLGAADLPATLAESLKRRVDAVAPDARDLAEALSVAESVPLAVTDYRALTSHRDQTRLFRALEQLVSARILIAGVDRYRFSQRGFATVLLDSMGAPRKAALHGRVADLLAATGGDVLERAHHLMSAGREQEAVHLLCSLDLQARQPRLALLEQAAAYAARTGQFSARVLQRLRTAVLTKAAVVMNLGSFRRHLPRVIEQLERDSGLALYRELSDLPASERLGQALSRQQQRYDSAPHNEQVYSVVDAIRELARVVSATCGIAAAVFDLDLLDELPSLAPLLPLSPGLRVIEQVKAGTQHWLSGRTQLAGRIYEESLARITQPDHAGLDDVQFERMQLSLQYILALLEAGAALEHAEVRAEFLESRRSMRVNAWRVRSLLQLNRGDAAASLKSARRAELLQLQDDAENHYLGTSAAYQLSAAMNAADLLAVKSATDLVATLAEQYPGWRPMSIFGQSCYRYLRGDLQGALDVLRTGFEISQPGCEVAWGLLATHHVRLLRELGRIEEALAHAQKYVEIIQAEELSTAQGFAASEAALTLAAAGRQAEALAMMDPLIAHVESMGSRGLVLGLFYEARARIAIAMADREAFERYSQLCAREYQIGKNPAVLAKLARLMEHARQEGLASGLAPLESAWPTTFEPASEEDEDTIVSRMLECVDACDRARCALSMLLQSTDGYLGYLYGVNEGGLIPLASIPETDGDPQLEGWLARWLHAERELAAHAAVVSTAAVDVASLALDVPTTEAGPTESETADARYSSPMRYVDPEGRELHPVMLVHTAGGQRKVAALLALNADRARRRPPAALLQQIARQLLAHKDVQGIVLGDVG